MKSRPVMTLAVPALMLSLAAAYQHRVAKARTPTADQTEVRTLPTKGAPQLKLLIDGAVEQIGQTTGYDLVFLDGGEMAGTR
jgi:hypothetical protein